MIRMIRNWYLSQTSQWKTFAVPKIHPGLITAILAIVVYLFAKNSKIPTYFYTNVYDTNMTGLANRDENQNVCYKTFTISPTIHILVLVAILVQEYHKIEDKLSLFWSILRNVQCFQNYAFWRAWNPFLCVIKHQITTKFYET